MSRQRIAILVLIGTLFAASVFGSDLVVLAEKVPSFLVINDEKHPVPVRELSDPGRSAYTSVYSDFFQSGGLTYVFRFPVPEGKRLVIEAVSLRASLPEAQTLVTVKAQIRVNERNLFHHLGPTSHGTDPEDGQLVWVVSEARTLYADGGTEVLLTALRSADDGSGPVQASVSGHLIDCEVAPCQ